MNGGELGLNLLVGIVTGVVASVLTVFLMRHAVTPHILIAPKIAKGVTTRGNMAYRFKIVNMKRETLYGISAHLHHVIENKDPDNPVVITRPVPLTQNNVIELSGYDPNDAQTRYAYRFLTYEDLEAILAEPGHSLRLRVVATSGLSGATRTFTMDFAGAATPIVAGKFGYGHVLDIDPDTTDPVVPDRSTDVEADVAESPTTA